MLVADDNIRLLVDSIFGKVWFRARTVGGLIRLYRDRNNLSDKANLRLYKITENNVIIKEVTNWIDKLSSHFVHNERVMIAENGI